MNQELILALLEQAGVKYATMPKDTVYEKFANLIVKECVLISQTSTDRFSAGQRMEEHFGVEKSRSQKLKEAGFTRRYKTWTKEKDDEI